MTEPDRPHVVFIDHSGVLGGGQLGLLRYLAVPSAFRRSLVVFEDGPLVDKSRAAGHEVRVLDAATSNIDKLRIAARVRSITAELRPDLVVTNSLTAMNVVGLAPVHGVPSIAYLREDLSPANIRPGLKRTMMERITLRAFAGFFANSNYTASTVPRRFEHIPVTVVNPVCGVTEIGGPEQSRDGAFTVVSLSRLDEWKGVHVLVEAARILSQRNHSDAPVRFLIAGGSSHADPAYAASLREAAASIDNVAVDFLGHVDDVTAVIDRAHVLVLPTIRPEPFGQVVVQAISRGRPVIATSGGGPAEILDAASGVVVPPSDPAALARVIAELAADPDRIRLMSSAARARAELFLDSRTTKEFEAALAAELGRPRSGRRP